MPDPRSPIPDNQEDVLRLLGDPATFGGAEVRRIDTHGAYVFLVGERVLKVKRAVRFPFLDYSTLEKRRTACIDEVAVNQAFAPQLYRGVVPITRQADGRLALLGEGTPVEWAVEMCRFDETRTLDRLADKGEIDEALADKLARAVAEAHAKTPAVEAGPWIASLAKILAQNDEEFRQYPDLFAVEEIAGLSNASRDALDRLVPLLQLRGELGLVRRGHGDLHLGNVALIDGEPLAFDAIEFDPLIATGDVLYDLAFLIMDLVERGLNAAANIVLNRYLMETRRIDDLDALAALPLFLSMRAAIRAKVTAARLAHAKESAREKIARAARTYFDLACRLITPAPPKVIAIGGLSGTGKSVLAGELAPELAPPPGAVLLRSDVERKALFGVGEHERLPADAYSREAGVKVYAALLEKASRAITAGHSVIVDAVFAKPEERRAVARAVAAAPFRGLFLTADLTTRLARIGGRERDASDADARVVREQEDFDLGDLDWTRVDASGTPAETLARAKAALD